MTLRCRYCDAHLSDHGEGDHCCDCTHCTIASDAEEETDHE